MEALQILLKSKSKALPLPPKLSRFYGSLNFKRPKGRPLIVANFVSTFDGVVSLGIKGKAGGGPISGNLPQDRAVMGLLRACADVVMEGAGTLRASPQSLLLPGEIYPPFAGDFAALRRALGKPPVPLRVIVSENAGVEPGWPLFSRGLGEVLMLTRSKGAKRLASMRGHGVTVRALPGQGPIPCAQILAALPKRSELALLEGGPKLLGSFLKGGCLDELFLTLAPQAAGRAPGGKRLGLVEGVLLAPSLPRWAKLSEARLGGSHLFLRYDFRA